MLPSLSELTIGVQTAAGKETARAEAKAAKKRARDEPRFFKNLILRPADYPSPFFELSSAIVVKKAGEADVRVDFTVNYEEAKPVRVRVKNDNKDTSGNCFDLMFQDGSTKVAYLSSLLRERDPSGCKIWRVNTTSMQSLGRTLVETTTIMMSHLNRGQKAELSLIDASVFTARKAPLVKWDMQEYLSVKRGYSFYEALGYGDVDHDVAKIDKEKMNECLRRNNLLFGTPIGELRTTLQREYPGDLRVQYAVRNVEEAMTDEQKKKWRGLSLRGLLEQMEEVAKKYDPRENAAIKGMQRARELQNVDYLKKTWLSLMETAGAAGALEIVTFLDSLHVDIGMPYRSNMFRKTLYPDPSGGHTHILIKSDGTAYEEVRVGEGDFRLVGMESNPEEVARDVKDRLFPASLLWLPERVLQR